MAKKRKLASPPAQQLTDKAKMSTIDLSILITILLTLAIAPIIVHMAFIDHISPHITGTTIDAGKAAEFFSYYQMLVTIIGAVIVLGLFLYKLIMQKYELPASYINIFVGALFLLIALSGAFAQYKTLSLFGQYDQHEGTLSYLAYLLLFFVTANLTYPTKQIKWFFYALYPLILINAALGLVYFYGINILHSQFFYSIIVSSDLTGKLSPSSYISSTLSNPDFVSGIAGVLTLMFLTKAILDTTLARRIVSGVVALLCFAIIITSFATSGFFTLVVLSPVVIIVMLLNKQRKAGIITAGVTLVCFVLLFSIISSHDQRVWNKSMGFFLGNRNAVSSTAAPKPAAPAQPSVAQPQASLPEFNLPPQKWAAGTGRAYIWLKTAQLIEKKPILGYGMDTLTYTFPQDDPTKASGIYDPNVVVDKPHDMYLDFAYGAGVFALMAFLLLIFRHIWAFGKQFTTPLCGERAALVTTLFVGWLAFLVQALFNDPTTGTSVIFWILFGIGVSVVEKAPSEKVKNN
ncbi:MAG: O-antigen ligase family protein [Peptococcaceae bacterium]|nr:O-antigen ligase family protein [Peptococcaceae bacterium]